MSESNEVIEWKFPREIQPFAVILLVSMSVLIGTVCAQAYILDPSLAGTNVAKLMLFGGAGALVMFCYGTYTLMKRAVQTHYFADGAGIHGDPIFDFQWKELKSVSAIKYFPGSTKLLIMRARKPYKFMTIGFDANSVDEAHLLEFANRKIAEAAPTT
ncbi:MAG: hypothetical protein K8R88_00180 [Armatimonadetes bacterium]|nr:hypothetical protein [Armatimonadota bacterium]